MVFRSSSNPTGSLAPLSARVTPTVSHLLDALQATSHTSHQRDKNHQALLESNDRRLVANSPEQGTVGIL